MTGEVLHFLHLPDDFDNSAVRATVLVGETRSGRRLPFAPAPRIGRA
jgi:hypothetical protein